MKTNKDRIIDFLKKKKGWLSIRQVHQGLREPALKQIGRHLRQLQEQGYIIKKTLKGNYVGERSYYRCP